MRGIRFTVLMLGSMAFGQAVVGQATRGPVDRSATWGYTVYTQKRAPLHTAPEAESEVKEFLIAGTKLKVDYCGSIWCAAFWSYDRERSLKKARGYVRLADLGKHAPPRRENPRLQQRRQPQATQGPSRGGP